MALVIKKQLIVSRETSMNFDIIVVGGGHAGI
jgi:glycerol-3-phosphate dehydrogenase